MLLQLVVLINSISNKVFINPPPPLPHALLQVRGEELNPPLDPPPTREGKEPRQHTRRLGLSDFTFLQVLGKGSFGKVRLDGVVVVYGASIIYRTTSVSSTPCI